MKEKIGSVLFYVIIVGTVAYMAFSAVSDLTNRRDVHTVTIQEAYSVLQIEHSINGLIPIGTDYYYLGVNDENGDAYLIKASKKWLKNNFDEEFQSKEPNGLQITGLVKKVSDFKTEYELENRLSVLEGVQYPYEMTGCMNLNYIMIALLKLFDVLFLIVVFFTGRYIVKYKNTVSPLLIKVWLVGLVVTIGLSVVILGK